MQGTFIKIGVTYFTYIMLSALMQVKGNMYIPTEISSCK